MRPIAQFAVCILFLSGLTHAQESTFEGTWSNTTFQSTGTALFVLKQDFVLRMDLNGNVLGKGDPPAVDLPGATEGEDIVFKKSNDPFYGNVTVRFKSDGALSILFDKPPGGGIDRLEAKGLMVSGSDIDADYTVFFSAGGTALGKIEAEQTSGPTFHRLFFAQVAGGGGTATDLVFPNPTAKTANATVSFAGDNGAPLPIEVASNEKGKLVLNQSVSLAAQSEVNFSVAPLDSVTISLPNQGGLKVGSASVLSDQKLGGVARFNLSGFGIAGVIHSAPLEAFVIPVRRAQGGINTGIAFRLIASGTADIRLSLRRAGNEVAARTLTDFAANGHLAAFINELFPAVDTNNFKGTLVVRVEGGKAAATALELGPQPGQFTTLPVTPLEE